MDTKIKVPIFNNLELPILVPDLRLQNIQPVVKNIGLKVHQVPLAGRLRNIQDILSVIKGYQIPFKTIPVQTKPLRTAQMSKEQQALVDKEYNLKKTN